MGGAPKDGELAPDPRPDRSAIEVGRSDPADLGLGVAWRSEIGEAALQQGRPETTAANVSHGAQRPEPIRSIGAMARKADDPTVRQRAQVHSRRVVGEGDEHFVLPGRVGEFPSRELGQRRRVGCGRTPGRDRAERTREREGRHTEIAVEGEVHSTPGVTRMALLRG